MKILGILLAIFGVVALVYGGVTYQHQRTILDVGGIKATATEHKTGPISPLLGGAALVGGLVLLFSSSRRTR